MLLTHPHPDHYNTIGELLAGERVPVIAHRDVDREIRAKDDARARQWRPLSGASGQRDVPEPDGGRRGVGGARRAAVHRLGLRALRERSETVWLLGDGDTAFVGDLAFNGTHANLADGRTHAWLQALDRAEEALAGVRTLYVGHGPPAAPAVLADQRRYLLMAREAIGRAADGRAQLTEDEANRVAGLMERYLPGAPLSWLVAAGASAVAAELAQETAPR